MDDELDGGARGRADLERDDGFEDLVAGVLAAGAQAVAVMAGPEVADRWDEPSVLAEMTVGALAAHLNQMLGAGVAWLEADPADAAGLLPRPVAEVFGQSRVDGDEGLAGRIPRLIQTWSAEGSALGPVATAAQAADHLARLAVLLAEAHPTRLIPSVSLPGVAMVLPDYLRTRCIEFVVHTDDLAQSVGLPTPEPDPIAARAAIDVLVDLCRHRVGDVAVLRALTRPERADPDALRAL